MKQSLLYFVAAIVFAVATGLNFYNEGFNLKTAVGAVFIVALTMLGLRQRKAGN